MKKLLLIGIILVTGCMSRELLKTSSTNSTITGQGFVYENDTVKITYYFWAVDGIMSMKIYNKLNVPIFIDWKVSNFIDNDNNLQYWYDVGNSSSVSKSVSLYSLQSLTGVPASARKEVTNTTYERPDRLTSITPHSEIKKESYSIMPKYQGNYINAGDYTFDNSPLKFRNYLVFSMNEAFAKNFYVDNQFYVSHAEFIPENKFGEPTVNNPNRISPYKNPMYFYSEQVHPSNK